MVATQAELIRPEGEPSVRRRLGLATCLTVFAVLLGLYVADLFTHRGMLNWFDLRVYTDAGRVAQHNPKNLYVMVVHQRKFTYTPFAAWLLSFVAGAPWLVLERVVTGLSLLTVPVASWLTFGALGWRGARRVGAALALAGVALWLEPVQRALQLGQIELLLMLLLIWDLCQPDKRRLKGLGIGLAAGIKLVPLIFIPYLLLAGKIRQAVIAAATFAVTAILGWIFLPATFSSYWLSGYFMRPSGIGPVGGFRNQSVLGMLIRIIGSIGVATPVWIITSILLGVAGIGAAAVLHHAGQPVAGWVTCALTGLLISPVSWDHHWIWIVPILAVMIDWAVKAKDTARQAWWAGGIAAVLVYAAYPHYLRGPHAFVPIGGLIGLVNHKGSRRGVYDLHPALLLTWNLFVLAGLVLLAMFLVVAWRKRYAAKPRATPAEPAPGVLIT